MLVSETLTIASGVPQQVSTTSVPGTRVQIQCQPASTDGLIYVFQGVPKGTTPSTSTWPYITLAAGSASSGSDNFSDATDTGDESWFDVSGLWIDGSHTGDLVTVVFNRKN